VSVARAPSPAEAVSNVAEELRAQLAGAGEPVLRPLELGGVLLGPGILDRVADVVAELPRGEGDVALVADRRPMATAGGEVKATVAACLSAAGIAVRRVTVGDEDARVSPSPTWRSSWASGTTTASTRYSSDAARLGAGL
jgi:hypothetical protein